FAGIVFLLIFCGSVESVVVDIVHGLLLVNMEGGFLSPKGSGGRRCVKQKSGGSVDAPNGNKAYSFKRIEQRNLTKCSTLDSSTTFHISFGGNTRSISHAKLLNGEPSRKTVNLHPLLASVGNGADVAIFVESVHGVHERFSNIVCGFFLRTTLRILGSATPLPAMNNDLERQMLDGRLVLVDNDGKPLKS
nr:hypothetical protein [Tanacetum cinerariifolium]